MPRAYICLLRNDLQENLFQGTLDLIPNTSQRNATTTGPGQTGYLSFSPQNDTPVLADLGAGVFAPTATVFGLTAYLMDVVENTTGPNLALTAVQAGNIATAILAAMDAGTPLTAAALNLLVVAELGGGNDLTGTAGASFGTVADVLLILSGATFRISANAPISAAANAFPPAARAGAFTTAPNLIRAFTSGPGGRPIQTAPVVPVDDIDQTEVTPARNMGAGVALNTPATAELTHRELRTIVDTSSLHASILLGRMAHLVDPAFTWLNPSYTYGTGGTAVDVTGTAVPATGVKQAIIVYKADGTVI